MKIYDCFIFNDELEVLELRLKFLNNVVDYFVIVESQRTLSGHPKPLYFLENKFLFEEYLHKVIYLEAPVTDYSAWNYEYFQRNYIKEGLKMCESNDWILISDVDELVNLPELIKSINDEKPYLIELPMYYYWFNLKTNVTFCVNVFAPWKFLRDINLGERFNMFPKIFSNRIQSRKYNTGWHFSYLFGKDVMRYQKKIKSFSHQEYNTPYFLRKNRILKCIILGIDLFERNFMSLKTSNSEITPILPYIKELGLGHYLYSPSFSRWLNPGNLLFITRIKISRFLIKVKQFVFLIKNRLLSQ